MTNVGGIPGNSYFSGMPPQDPDQFAQQYAIQNNLTLEEAKAELKAKYGDPGQGGPDISIFNTVQSSTGGDNFSYSAGPMTKGDPQPHLWWDSGDSYSFSKDGPQEEGDPQPHLGWDVGGPQQPGDPDFYSFIQGGPQNEGDPQPHLGWDVGGPQQPGDPDFYSFIQGGPQNEGDPQPHLNPEYYDYFN